MKTMSFQTDTSYMDARSMLFDESNTHQTPPSPSPQWLYSPRSPSYSPPASLPSRESSVEPHSEDSLPTGRKRNQSEPTFIRPHDIDRGLTYPDFQFYCRKCHLLAPYKVERSAKARARQAFSTMCWTPFKTLQRKIGNWYKLTPFKTLCSYVAHNLFVLTPFKACDSSSNWLISRPYVRIQHKTV